MVKATQRLSGHAAPPGAATAAGVSYHGVAAFVIAVNATLASSVFATQSTFFLPVAVVYFSVIVALVTAVEVLVLAVLWRWLCRRPWMAAAAVGIVVGAGARYSLVAVFLADRDALAVVVVVTAFLLGAAFVRIPAARPAAYAFLLIFVALNLLFQPKQGRARDAVPPPEPVSAASMRENLARANRNVYLIAFDALISEESFDRFFRRHSNLQELPWTRVLVGHGMAAYDRALAADSYSTSSFMRTLAFGAKLGPTAAVENFADFKDFFGGALPVPAYDVARAAGMRSQFLSSSSYFGVRNGSHIDYLYPEKAGQFCWFVPEDLFGIACRPWMADIVRPYGLILAYEVVDDWPLIAKIKRRVAIAAAAPDRWLTIAYASVPGHTDAAFDIRDEQALVEYVARFDTNSVKAARMLSELVGAIKTADPGAVIVVTGDHGARLTQKVQRELAPAMVELDMRGVGFFVYPADTCAETFRRPGYDLGLVLHDLFLCLKPAQP